MFDYIQFQQKLHSSYNMRHKLYYLHIKAVYKACYHSAIVHYEEYEDGMIAGNALSGRDDMRITVAGNEDRILLISVFDNLGKGASGAAIQNLNILLGIDETTGLLV